MRKSIRTIGAMTAVVVATAVGLGLSRSATSGLDWEDDWFEDFEAAGDESERTSDLGPAGSPQVPEPEVTRDGRSVPD